MARKRGVRVTLLVEDRMIERFAVSVLQRLGFHRKELFVEPYPVGRGSNNQWIDQRYATLVRVQRAKGTFQNLALLVGTDADELTLAQRTQRLADTLVAASLSPRDADEAITHWIPKWNIETWILTLSGDGVDENHDYKHRVKSPLFDQIAEEFVRRYRIRNNSSSSDSEPPSLLVAYVETDRLR